MSEQNKQYDGPPSTFVNTKRVRLGEDSKGRQTTTVTFGLTKNRDGVEINSADSLREALNALEGKQVNLTIHVEEKVSDQGRKFPSAFVRVTEMIPKDAGGGGRTQYVPKASKAEATANRTNEIRAKFGQGK